MIHINAYKVKSVNYSSPVNDRSNGEKKGERCCCDIVKRHKIVSRYYFYINL